MKFLTAILLVSLLSTARGQVIDTHLHGWTDDNYPRRGPSAPATGSEHMRATIAAMDEHDVRFAVISGNMDALAMWTAADDRFIPGYQITGSNIISPEAFEAHVEAGRIKVLGEFAPLFVGKTPADPSYTPYLEVAERYGVPLAIHTGTMPPMAPLTCCPEARISLGDPLLVEDVLVRHPKLKVYLRQAKLAGMLDRVMFGSDQMNWPQAIGDSVAFLESLPFLTDEEKRMVLYDNALRFFGLEPKP